MTAGFSVRRAFSFFSISAPTPGFASGFASVDVTVDETVASTVAASLTIALSSTNDVAVGICTTASTAATDSLLTTTPCEFDSLLTVLATAAAAAFVLATSAVGLGASCDVVAVSYAAIAAASAVFCASALDAPGEVVDFLASADDIAEVEDEVGDVSFAGDVSVELFLTASATGLGASVDAGGDGDSGGGLVGAAAAVEASGSFPGSAFFSAAFSGFSPISVPTLPVAGFTSVDVTVDETVILGLSVVASFTAGAALASALVAASAPAARSVEVELDIELESNLISNSGPSP